MQNVAHQSSPKFKARLSGSGPTCSLKIMPKNVSAEIDVLRAKSVIMSKNVSAEIDVLRAKSVGITCRALCMLADLIGQ